MNDGARFTPVCLECGRHVTVCLCAHRVSPTYIAQSKEVVAPGECYVCSGKPEPNFGHLENVKCRACNDTGHVHEVSRTLLGAPIAWYPARQCECRKDTAGAP
jgi:hypothetical protein